MRTFVRTSVIDGRDVFASGFSGKKSLPYEEIR